MVSTIYMPLQDEGIEVWRPVAAKALGGRRYRVIAQAPNDEVWAFPSGSIVLVDHEQRITSQADG